jgi:hypothetical protein
MSEQTNWILEVSSSPGEESLKGFYRSFFPHPEQAGDAGVDLIDQGEIVVALGKLEFVDPDGRDRGQGAMLQAPFHNVLYGLANLVPGGTEGLGGFLPGKFARPTCQKQHVGLGQLVFAVGPRHFLDDDTAGFAVDAAHAVEEKDQIAPDGNELELPIREVVVTGGWPVTARTDGWGTYSGADADLQAAAILGEVDVLINEAREAVALVEQRDNLHGGMAKESSLQPWAATNIEAYCKDLAEWPKSWMGLPEDLIPGEKMVAYFRPFLQHLVELGLSRKTIRKHVDNLWVLGGEMIRDLHETPALRKVPMETLVFNMIQDGGPILYHNDSEEQQRSFESTCNKFRRFLREGNSSALPKKRWK